MPPEDSGETHVDELFHGQLESNCMSHGQPLTISVVVYEDLWDRDIAIDAAKDLRHGVVCITARSTVLQQAHDCHNETWQSQSQNFVPRGRHEVKE